MFFFHFMIHDHNDLFISLFIWAEFTHTPIHKYFHGNTCNFPILMITYLYQKPWNRMVSTSPIWCSPIKNNQCPQAQRNECVLYNHGVDVLVWTTGGLLYMSRSEVGINGGHTQYSERQGTGVSC